MSVAPLSFVIAVELTRLDVIGQMASQVGTDRIFSDDALEWARHRPLWEQPDEFVRHPACAP